MLHQQFSHGYVSIVAFPLTPCVYHSHVCWVTVLTTITGDRWLNETLPCMLQSSPKVPILKECHFGKVKLWDFKHFWINTFCLHSWAWLLNTVAITPKSEDKKCPKVFNVPEFHFSEVYFFQNWYFSSLTERSESISTEAEDHILSNVPE